MAEKTENPGGSNLLLYASIVIGALAVAGGGYWYFVMKPKSGSASSSSAVDEGGAEVNNGKKIDVMPKMGEVIGIKIDVNPKQGRFSETEGGIIGKKKRGIVSQEAIAKRASNPSYAGYEDYLPADKYAQFWGAIRQFVKTTEPPASDTSFAGRTQKKKFDDDYSVAESTVRGFLKGMNLAMKPEYLTEFKPFIDEYLSSPGRPHWDIGKVGQFIA